MIIKLVMFIIVCLLLSLGTSPSVLELAPHPRVPQQVFHPPHLLPNGEKSDPYLLGVAVEGSAGGLQGLVAQ